MQSSAHTNSLTPLRVERRHFLCGCSTLIAASFLSASWPSSNRWTSLLSDIENQIPPVMSEMKVPGVSMVLIRDATIAWQGCFGVKDASSGSPVDADTMFE